MQAASPSVTAAGGSRRVRRQRLSAPPGLSSPVTVTLTSVWSTALRRTMDLGAAAAAAAAAAGGRLQHGLQHELQEALDKVAPFDDPDIELEQYPTDASLAASMLATMAGRGDVAGKAVLDLGTGCGVLAIGASLLGAASVLGVDLDPSALEQARQNCDRCADLVASGGAAGGLGTPTVELMRADLTAEPGTAGCVLQGGAAGRAFDCVVSLTAPRPLTGLDASRGARQ